MQHRKSPQKRSHVADLSLSLLPPSLRAGPARAGPPLPSPSLRSSGTHIALRIWVDQRIWLEENGIELSPLVRELIDILRGRSSAIADGKRRERALHLSALREMGRRASQAAKARLAARAELSGARDLALARLRRDFEAQHREQFNFAFNVEWVRARIRPIPALRFELPEVVLDQLTLTPLEGR